MLLAASAGQMPSGPFVSLSWGLVAAIPFLALHLASPEGLGGGDVKLAALVGAGMGPWGLAALLGGCVSAVSWGLVVSVRRRVRPGVVELPLAPFICAGVIAVIVAG